ncbi:aminotransferase class V-fold PLP-dependent enzyme [Alteromonas oceanisediminis]|uniref:aminotransferase class V-fold PLP-dependent enzyme n=1 Tax=Alteromonas oceanisediminis TaxID=2836180 RepID=UPI001BD951BB|nr:aminotransferase class V-fold PLP-dependent enzyme [Alteromonas oceanisediminis]MBT0587257.1 aminotransferase class V-fold PLP-dependent enzyme [Alteromonas oceanisediminis]
MTPHFRHLFPYFADQRRGVYADSAATSHKLNAVVSATQQFLQNEYATVHRGNYSTASAATSRFEQVRRDISEFINAPSAHTIVFTKGATESLNLIEAGLQAACLQGDEILICGSEHHANFVPWQRLALRLGLTLSVFHLRADGSLDQTGFIEAITQRTALVAIAHVSNALGNLYAVEKVCRRAAQMQAVSVIDGTQAISHLSVDVQAMGCDFYVFSGHKMYASTGTGVLYGKAEKLAQLRPYQLGGEMVSKVDDYSAEYQPVPYRFEAGTPNVVGVIGLGQAVAFLRDNIAAIAAHENALARHLRRSLLELPDVQLYGDCRVADPTVPIASFTIHNVHANDVALSLNQQDIAVRQGHHCAMPLMQQLGVSGTVRISLAAYNTEDDIDAIVTALRKAIVQLRAGESAHLIAKHAADTPQSLGDKITRQKSWDGVLREVILAGKSLNVLSAEHRNDSTLVSGCEADVWLARSSLTEGEAPVWQAYSGSKIVRGLLAVVLEKANYSSIERHSPADFHQYLVDIGLSRYLSESRRNGLNAVIAQICADDPR